MPPCACVCVGKQRCRLCLTVTAPNYFWTVSQFAFLLYLYFCAVSFIVVVRSPFFCCECNELKSRTVGQKEQRVEIVSFANVCVCMCVTVTINCGMCSILTYGHQSISCVCVCVCGRRNSKKEKAHGQFPQKLCYISLLTVCVCCPHKFTSECV